MNTVVAARLRVSSVLLAAALIALLLAAISIAFNQSSFRTIANVSAADTASNESMWNGAYARPELSPGSTFANTSVDDCVTAAENVVIDTSVIDDVFASYGILPAERSEYTVVRVIPVALGGDNTAANLYPQLKSTMDASSDAVREARYTSAACR